MAEEPIDDITAWSEKLTPWKQDCLRRLAISADLSAADHDELLHMIKVGAGFHLDAPAPVAIPFTKAHFGAASKQPLVLKGVANVSNINRLRAKAALTFCPKALTLVYGRNGSGKSGFVRILRTACRTRVEKPEKLKVLADVYGAASGPQTADIIIDTGQGDTAIPWAANGTASPHLMKISVFDTQSAQLYVDNGNQIRFLPFGLALPHRLNAVGLELKKRLDAERAATIGNRLEFTALAFPTVRPSAAQSFYRSIRPGTTDPAIKAATAFTPADADRLTQIVAMLTAGATALADLGALLAWCDALALECAALEVACSDAALDAATALKARAVAARQAAEVAGKALFTDEPLQGVGSESWRLLWAAARDYSLREAYRGGAFPVLSVDEDPASCVLCQQPLQPAAAGRLQRFQRYMDDALDAAAAAAEKSVRDAVAALPPCRLFDAADFDARRAQIRDRVPQLADALAAFHVAIRSRVADARARLDGAAGGATPPLVAVAADARFLADTLRLEKDALAKVAQTEERTILVNERAELDDRQLLAANAAKLKTRRDLLAADAAYERALAELQTQAITKRANELLDKHLTAKVVERFAAERQRFDITHLKVGLARKSGQTKAEFDIDPGTKLTRMASDILSEGEQRALALAGFLTEVALTDGAGPVVIDDPVSSLDRERSARVAERLVEEAQQRQVIVFTHDIVFFNEMCACAETKGIEPVTIALFSDKDAAGKVDPAGMLWRGAPVEKRINRLRSDLAPLVKLHAASPSDYEYQIKNLYGRLRDCYERVVEEIIFRDIVRRGVDAIHTQKLRLITLPDDLALRFHEGMTRANTYSHDNPGAETVPVRTPDQFKDDLVEIRALIEAFGKAQAAAAKARPRMA